MLPFVLGYAAVFAALYGFGFWHDAAWLQHDAASASWLFLLVVALPVTAAWVAAEGVHVITPRRMFDHRTPGLARRILLGVVCAGIAASSTALLLPVADRFVPESAVMALCAAVCTALPLLFAARLRPGCCVRCGYDLRGLTSEARGRCPECGKAGTAYERRRPRASHGPRSYRMRLLRG